MLATSRFCELTETMFAALPIFALKLATSVGALADGVRVFPLPLESVQLVVSNSHIAVTLV